MSSPQIDLYTASTPNGWKVSVFLEETGLPYSVHRIDLGKGKLYQRLDANGFEQFAHDGVQVAKLTLSSTEDYGLAVDSTGYGILAFLDDRRNPNNPQVTGAKVSPTGGEVWGPNGIALTNDPGSHNDPKVTVTSDGFIVIGWTNGSVIQLQKLTTSGLPLWIGQTALGRGTFVERQIKNRVEQSLRAMAAEGMDPRQVKLDWAKVKESQRDKALHEVKASMLLSRISEREAVHTTREEK